MSARHMRHKAEDEDASQLKFGPEFSGEVQNRCLSTSEVKSLLENIDHRSTDSPIFKKTVEYLGEFSRFKDIETQKLGSTWPLNMLYRILNQIDMTPFEVVQIANLVPSSVEEAKALIPSLSRIKGQDEENLEDAIRQVVALRKYQG